MTESDKKDFAGMDFTNKDLRGADFRGANLERVDFWEATVNHKTDFRGANLCGAKNLTYRKLAKAKSDVIFFKKGDILISEDGESMLIIRFVEESFIIGNRTTFPIFVCTKSATPALFVWLGRKRLYLKTY